MSYKMSCRERIYDMLGLTPYFDTNTEAYKSLLQRY